MCRPSNRFGSSGCVIAPYGGRAIGCMAENASRRRVESALVSGVTGSLHTAKLLSRGTDPLGWSCISIASPPGWSMRSPHVRTVDPGRVELKSRYLPSGEKRGFELSVLGDVYRVASPPAAGTTHTSACRLFSLSRTVVTVNATSLPSGDMAGAESVVTLYQSAGVYARRVAEVVAAGVVAGAGRACAGTAS